MALLFTLKKGARLPSQVWTLTSSATFDLDAADTVEFVYRLNGASERLTETLTVVDAEAKTVRLDPSVAISDSEGTHQCHVEVTIGGLRMDFPITGFDTFKITPTIEAP